MAVWYLSTRSVERNWRAHVHETRCFFVQQRLYGLGKVTLAWSFRSRWNAYLRCHILDGEARPTAGYDQVHKVRRVAVRPFANRLLDFADAVRHNFGIDDVPLALAELAKCVLEYGQTFVSRSIIVGCFRDNEDRGLQRR